MTFTVAELESSIIPSVRMTRSSFPLANYDEEKRFDILISFHGRETLSIIDRGEKAITTSEFVDKYFIPEIHEQWKKSEYEGRLNIFHDDKRDGNMNNSIFGAIATFQVNYDW